MGVNIGNKELKDAYIGDKPIKKIYLGDKLLWQRLPYEAEIEYLEGSGTQYIDTLIVPTKNTSIECKYVFKEYNNTQIVFGCTDSATSNDAKNGILNLHLTAGTRRVGFGNGSGTIFASNTLSQPNTEYVIYFNKNTVYVNETFIKTFPTSDWSTDKTLYIFGRNGGIKYPLNGYIEYFKMWDGETLVRDYIPVRVGQVGYMYDKVSGQLFGNSGTGNFILGNDI